jgi:MoxR-like ATPase
VLELVLAAVLCDGHVLLEDYPGLAKTLAARSFAQVLGIDFARIQFTPDLMPSDVTGSSIWNQRDSDFEFRPGPIFTNLLLADEINRAPPKTQAALLEAMQERQATIEGVTHRFEPPFLVVATQNPIEYEGTYPLPEAQLDRFTARLSLGYPPPAEEARMLGEQTTSPPLDHLRPVAERAEVLAAIAAAREVFVEESVNRYVVELLRHTRGSSRLALGASPRAGIALLRMAKARAVARTRDYVLPEDVQRVAVAVLSHRLIVGPEARASGLTGEDAVREALDQTAVPV